MSALQLARTVADRYAALRPVQAVALSGSRSSKQSDESSDIDLYVYVNHPLTLAQRAQVAAGAKRVEIGNNFWEPGDEWVDPESGLGIDAMYRELEWIEEQIARVLNDHKASIGYSTCFWYNVRNSELLFDRESWFAQLQLKASAPYPPELKRAIIAKNHPILRTTISSYVHQIEVAQRRHDVVAVNHRITALLASYFDILFAVNEQTHPGEKRLLKFAEELCPKRPSRMKEDVERVVEFRSLAAITELLDGLDGLLRRERLLPL
jgi:predicted nucleotidyltransferase